MGGTGAVPVPPRGEAGLKGGGGGGAARVELRARLGPVRPRWGLRVGDLGGGVGWAGGGGMPVVPVPPG